MIFRPQSPVLSDESFHLYSCELGSVDGGLYLEDGLCLCVVNVRASLSTICS